MMKRNRITFSRQQRARFGRRPFSLPHPAGQKGSWSEILPRNSPGIRKEHR